VLLTKLHRSIGIAFEVDFEFRVVQSGQGKHLSHHLENQGCFIKRKLFGHMRFAQTVYPEFFYVHLINLQLSRNIICLRNAICLKTAMYLKTVMYLKNVM
jgi:hypothetical protein